VAPAQAPGFVQTSTSASVGGSFGYGADLGGRGPSLDGAGERSRPDDAATRGEKESAYRLESLKEENSLDAATGLLRLYGAGSGAVGTFRFSLLSSYFAGTGFLCNSSATCADQQGGVPTREDDLTHIGGHVGISATPLPFLEAYLGVHTSATSDNLSHPGLLQVLGDTNFGVKAFMPHEEGSIFSAGGAAEMWLLNGTGTVGIDSASFALRGVATADFSNGSTHKIPLRTYLNIGYLFDNSGKLVDSVEKHELNGHRITRIERFGLGINRVDSLNAGLGLEGMFGIVRPFLEWTIDVPVNRQNHVCNLLPRAAGDECLGQNPGFSTTPSRLGIGARVHALLPGLSFLGAVEVGTGATSSFLEEVSPELPWNLYFGIAYAADTEPRVEVRRVEVNRAIRVNLPPPQQIIQGSVVEKGSGLPIQDAIVRFEGRNLTGMVTTPDGTFRTSDLPAGTYTFDVSAPGYRDGQCSATIFDRGAAGPLGPGLAGNAPPAGPGPYGPSTTAPVAAQPYGVTYTPPAGPQPGPYGAPAQPPGMPGEPGRPGVPAAPGAGASAPSATVTCELEALPKVGNVNGSLRDAETSAAVPSASVKITDKLGRSLSLTADAAGAFRFENVPPGPVTIAADAPGYLRGVIELEVKPRADVTTQLPLNKRPKTPNVVVTDREVKLKKAVHFQHDSAEILPDSMSIIEEIADVLNTHSEIPSVEIQGHTDDSGTPPYNLRLSSERANAVREALILNGVDPNRLTARGYGQEKPLVPNTNEANRARNRRVQLMIQK
jgi:outer membrane protein OmpA-like peptidoglycan-associated protein